MFTIEDGRAHFYQWDIDRRLIVEDETICQVHFFNGTEGALICEVYEEEGKRLVNVPNILLQTDWTIRVYAYDGKATIHHKRYEVAARPKPTDYAYTETEILNWSAIDSKVTAAIEEAEQAASYADEATDKAGAATRSAYNAASYADEATTAANAAAHEAYLAKIAAEEATAFAYESATGANEAATRADTAAGSVNDAIKEAEEATEGANKAKEEANKATADANNAAQNTNKATADANTATAGANEAATKANEAATKANEAATNANDAADNANAARESIVDITSKVSNALKGTAEGVEYVVLNDVSPIPHDITVTENVGGVFLLRMGKNHFNYKAWVEYCNGNGGSGATETVMYLGEECFSYKVLPRDGSLRFLMDGIQENTQYTLTMEYAISAYQGNDSYGVGALYIYYTDGTMDRIQPMAYATKFIKYIHTTQAGKTVLGFRIPGFDKNATIYVKKNMQFEIGIESTESMPYVEPVEYYSDGNPIKIPSLYPTTVVTCIEAAELGITAEYNRDINKAFAELQNAIISLGGNV